MTAMLRTMVFVIVPTVLMHRMLTLDHDLITRHERRLAEIARLSHWLALEAHLVACIVDDILAHEEAVTDIGFQELEYKPHEQEEAQSDEDACDDNFNHGIASNDNGAIDRAKRELCLPLGYQVATLLVVEGYLQDMKVASEDFVVGLLQRNLIVGEVDMVVVQDIFLYFLPVKR